MSAPQAVPPLAAVVMAAGAGRRMGHRPKALLRRDGEPLVVRTVRLLREAGVEHLFLISFTRAFSQITAQSFMTDILGHGLGIQHLVTGADFRFGHRRGGDAQMLASAPFGYTPVKPLLVDGEPCSSTRIRQALRDGNPQHVRELLGRDFEVMGRVLQGDKRGREWGFPTANIAPAEVLFKPAYGIYAVTLTRADGSRHPGVANYGIRPMYPLTRPLLEAHLFDVSLDLYGERVKVALQSYLRPEKVFASREALVEQIKQDSADARAYFGL